MSRSAKRKHSFSANEHQKTFLSLIEAFGYSRNYNEVFSDFVEMAAISFSNGVDLRQRDKREARYMEIVGKYKREEVERFPQMLGALTLAFEERMTAVREAAGCEVAPLDFTDVLGETYMMLELGNERAGQFFTPYSVSKMMAHMNLRDGSPFIERNGFVRIQEPACGAGGMVIACADALHSAGHNYQQTMHATCIDIDPRCVHMTYLQLSLLHIPAIVVHGNALTLEEWAHWFTPAHVLGGWSAKLRRAEARTDECDEASNLVADEVVMPEAGPIILQAIDTPPDWADAVGAPGLPDARRVGQMMLF